MPPYSTVSAPKSPRWLRASTSSKASKSWMPASILTIACLPFQREIQMLLVSTVFMSTLAILSISTQPGAHKLKALGSHFARTVSTSPTASEICKTVSMLPCSIRDAPSKMLSTNSASLPGIKTSPSGIRLSTTATRSTDLNMSCSDLSQQHT